MGGILLRVPRSYEPFFRSGGDPVLNFDDPEWVVPLDVTNRASVVIQRGHTRVY